MKNIFKLVFILSILGATACGGNSNPFGSDDPFEDQPEEIKKGEAPKGPQPPDEKPLGKDVFVIDGEGFADHIVLEQNSDREVILTARSFFANSQYRLEITNLKSFKGATAEYEDGDTTTGQVATAKFKWTPTSESVFDMINEYKLEVAVYTTNLKNVYKDRKAFTVFVYREDYSAPEVVSIQKLSTSIKENATATFKVEVRDVDGLSVPNEARPTLMILPNYAFGANIAPYMTVGLASQTPGDPTLWNFSVTVNLSKAELTDSSISGNFFIAAKSRFDKVSVPMSGTVDIWSQVAAPKSSWPATLKFEIGAFNQYTFIVQDPKAEGIVSVNFLSQCASWPGAPDCSCEPVFEGNKAIDHAKACTIKWQVPEDITQTSWFLLYDGVNMSKNKNDTTPTTSKFQGAISLVNEKQ